MTTELASSEPIESLILLIRGQRVILDADLARLYGVTTKRLNEQIRRNAERFPDDFMFRLTHEETASLRSHFATLKTGRGAHRKYLPYALTEFGAIMAANILNSRMAVTMSIYVVRAFINLKNTRNAFREVEHKLTELEQRVTTHDEAIRSLFSAIRKLMEPPNKPQRKIGFDLDK